MLINLSNHPSSRWSAEQRQAAEQAFGGVVDLEFPPIDPTASSQAVLELAQNYLQQVLDRLTAPLSQQAVHIMGEMTFTYAFVSLAHAQGVRCVASTSRRNVTELEDGKQVHFRFVAFRDYITV